MSSPNARRGWTRFGVGAFFAAHLLAVVLAFRVSLYLTLVYLYGPSRVCGEGLHFVDTPKGHPWVVSNGDLVADPYCVNAWFAAPLWLLFFLTLLGLAVRFSPWPLWSRAGFPRRAAGTTPAGPS
jgi:hypothetical protein